MATKPEYRYFTLRESHDEQRHIGTVAVLIHIDNEPHYHFFELRFNKDRIGNMEEANKQLNEAVERALSEHFDEPCTLVEPLKINDYMGTDPHDITFTFTYHGEENPHEEQFEIEQTWLYE